MDHYDVKRLALILAKQAKIEAMKADNKQAEILGYSLPYSGDAFTNILDDLENLAYSHNEQL